MGLLYSIVKYSGRIGLPVYFGKLEINGRENIPKNLPYIIAPNHQSAFLDAVVVGVYNDKPVHFLTRSDVFVNPFIGALNALNMMPVYRMRDGYEKLRKNEETFAKCDQLLEQNRPVLIFPEGNMGDGHFLRPLTKGTSRMAFQAQNNIEEDLFILPVGINYFHHDRPRYKCILNFGKPIRVRDYSKLFEKHKAKGLISLRDELSKRIKDLLLIPEKTNYENEVQGLNRATENHDFIQTRSLITKGQYPIPTYYPQLKFLSWILVLFNPLSIFTVDYVLNSIIKERQFTGSLKYILGLFLSIIWWIILGVCVFIISDVATATVVTLLSVFCLIFRSELKKFTHSIYRQPLG